VSGGFGNTAAAQYACVTGGLNDTASGLRSICAGGELNVASGNNSFAAGYAAKARHTLSFVWNNVGGGLETTAPGQFLIDAYGGVGIHTNAPYEDLTMGGSIGFKTGSGVMLYMAEYNSNNSRMVLAHSPDFPTWGLEFEDSDNEFKFQSSTATALSVDLSAQRVGIGVGEPTNILQVQQGSPTDPVADAWDTYSSRRWKTNIRPITSSLEKIQRLQGVEYDWKEGGKHDIGLIAEEVGEVIPEVVTFEANGVDAQSLDYARLVALLIEGMKEQQKQIEELKVTIRRMQP
jgi:hypothetical protein